MVESVKVAERAYRNVMKQRGMLIDAIFTDGEVRDAVNICTEDMGFSDDVTVGTGERERGYNDTFRLLIQKWKGNFLFMPWKERMRVRDIMMSALYHRYRVNLSVKMLAKLDLYFMTKFVLGYNDLSPGTHLPFCSHVVKNISRNLNVIPRGYFKTTITTKAGSIFCIVNDPNIRILIVNATATNAEAFLKEIKGHFENNSRFKKLFREIVPDNFRNIPWSNDKIQVKRKNNYSEPTIRAVGLETNITSGHFNLIIEDDLVNEDHLTSPEMMMKPIEWHKMSNSLYVPSDNPKKKMVWTTGTRWSYFDFIHDMMERVPKKAQYILSCYDDEGRSTFPEKYPVEELNRIRVDQGTQIFSCQYENNPLPGEIAVFRKEWFKYYDELPKDVPLRAYMLCDPAISEKRTADNRALVVVYIDEKKNWYVEEYVRGIFPLVDEQNSGRKNMTGELFRLYEKHKPEFVGIEDVGFQKAWKFEVQNQMKARKMNFHIWSLAPRNKQTKAMRIESLAGPISSGRVFFKGKEGDMKELEIELLGYPVGRYDDLVDALSYLVQHEVAPSEPLLRDENPLLVENILREIRKGKQSEYPFDSQVRVAI